MSGIEGGNERHWRSLTAALNDVGHDAELIAVVSPENDLVEVMASYAMFEAMDLSAFDVVISGKYPSFMVRHPKHIRHLNHPLRGLYEHYPAGLPLDVLPELVSEIDACGEDVQRLTAWATAQAIERAGDPVVAFPGPFARAVVQRLDMIGRDRLLAEAAVSDTVANRPGYVDPNRAISIIAPLGDLTIEERSTVAAPAALTDRPFLFTFGRLDHAKRFELIIAAFRVARRLPSMRHAELVVAGGGPLAARLEALAGDGVRVAGRLADHELTAHLRAATAVVLAPVDEDYGLVAAEAMAAGTPVITTSDSGGIAEQVEHGRSGLVVHPKPALVGAAMRSLVDDPARAATMGRSAADAVRGITWQPMFDLVQEVADDVDRPRVLLLSTFPADPVTSGGQRRLRGMAAGLRQNGWAPTILSLTNRLGPGQTRRRRTADGVVHVMVGRSAAHLEADFAMSSLLGTPVDDVAAAALWPATPAFEAELERQLDATDVVVLSHPFLAMALPIRPGGPPVVYDSHNVETSLKAAMFDHIDGGAWVADLAAECEAEAFDRASLVSATSAADLDQFEALGLLGTDDLRVVAPNPLAPEVIAPLTSDERQSARERFFLDLGRSDDGRKIALFVASNHGPNRAAAQRCRDLAAARPDLHIVISGSVRSGGGAATELGPFAASDLRRLHAMADIVLNPVSEGSGTSLKLIDALSLGIPVVATDVGARGLEDPDRVVWIADPTTSSLGSTIDGALADRGASQRRITAGIDIATQATPFEAMRELSDQMMLLVAGANS